jgi:hypothetical protein
MAVTTPIASIPAAAIAVIYVEVDARGPRIGRGISGIAISGRRGTRVIIRCDDTTAAQDGERQRREVEGSG